MLDVVVLTVGPLLTLEEAKQHLRVDDVDSDAIIEAYADAAVLSVLNYCDRKLVPQGAEPAFKAAALLMLGDLYNNRESVVAGQSFAVSPTIGALLGPYRSYRV
ncbi:head-tail connector protein [Brevundimonas sp.]|uniref:head-tail connector protein n=1 Tax=Brevundimonas sp. TaxID=1871086 RepID=UPI0028A80719|nr:head-tail connector protein [Brevundimonas sp.]